MNEFWKKSFELLEKYLPSFLVALGIGYKLGTSQKHKLWVELELVKMQKKRLEARNAILEKNKDKSDLDIVDDAISDGSGKDRR